MKDGAQPVAQKQRPVHVYLMKHLMEKLDGLPGVVQFYSPYMRAGWGTDIHYRTTQEAHSTGQALQVDGGVPEQFPEVRGPSQVGYSAGQLQSTQTHQGLCRSRSTWCSQHPGPGVQDPRVQ